MVQRTRHDVETEMLTVCADARAASTEGDDLSYDLDHARLNALLSEYQAIPLQAKPHD